MPFNQTARQKKSVDNNEVGRRFSVAFAAGAVCVFVLYDRKFFSRLLRRFFTFRGDRKATRRQIYPPYRPTFCGKRAKSENDKTACREAGFYGKRPLRRHGRGEFVRSRNLLARRKIIEKTYPRNPIGRIKNENPERAALTRLFCYL